MVNKVRFIKAHVIEQVAATRSLLKFCEDHRYDGDSGPDWPKYIRSTLKHLEAGRMKKAYEDYKQVHFGLYGFDEWLVPPVFPHEDAEYVYCVFQGLCSHWQRWMRMARIITRKR